MSNKFKVTRSYSYHVLCDSCGIKFWNHEVKKRWDGLMVCKDDWESRHPSDFYKTRNDAHKLPFIRSDTPADPMATWIPVINNITYTNRDGETGTVILFPTNPTGYYFADTTKGLTTARVSLIFTKPSASDATISLPVREAQSMTTGSNADITMPTTPTTAGTFTIVNDRGEFIKAGTVTAGNITVTLGSWTAKRGGITISAVYGT